MGIIAAILAGIFLTFFGFMVVGFVCGILVNMIFSG